MAQISLSVSTEFDSQIEVQPFEEGECLSINLRTNLAPIAGREHVYSKDWVTVHGSGADIRTLAERILAALPPVASTEAAQPEAISEVRA